MYIQNTMIPYDVLEYKGIQYGVCKDFKHLSRYRRLRQVAHCPDDIKQRYITLEIPNAFESNVEITYYDVPAHEEDRLDIIAYKTMGSAQYAWTIAYFNGISDGFTAHEGQRLKIPKSYTSLLNKGEIMSTVPPFTLNLGRE